MAKTKEKENGQVEALTVDQVRPLEYVEEGKSFYVTIQIGASCRWRQYAGGQWKPDPTRDVAPGEKAYRHHPALYERIGPFSGELVNGLISGHNKWLDANQSRAMGGMGGVQHQLLVLATEETDDTPIDRAGHATRFEKTIELAVEKAIAKAVPAILRELTQNS